MTSGRFKRPPIALRGIPASARAALISWVTVALALALAVWAVTLEWQVWLALAGLVFVGCAVVISGVRVPVLGSLLIGMFCFTASWDEVLVGPVNIRQFRICPA